TRLPFIPQPYFHRKILHMRERIQHGHADRNNNLLALEEGLAPVVLVKTAGNEALNVFPRNSEIDVKAFDPRNGDTDNVAAGIHQRTAGIAVGHASFHLNLVQDAIFVFSEAGNSSKAD